MPDPSNVRRHDRRNIDAIKGSLQRFGQQKPIVVGSDNVVIAGNGTLEAARELGWPSIQIVRSDLKGAERTAFAIADNRTASLAEWDDGALAEQLSALAIEDEALRDAAGYSSAELDALVDEVSGSASAGVDSDVEEDEAPEPPKDPVTKPGDLWVLGEHRVLCGDCAKLSNWYGIKAQAAWTDPPYGVDYEGKTADKLTIRGDTEGNLGSLLDGAFASLMSTVEAGCAWYVAAPAGPLHVEFMTRLLALGVYRQQLIWVKDAFVLGHSDRHYRHEPIFYGWTPGANHVWYGDRTHDSVIEEPRPKRSAEHPTMKPVRLVARCIEPSTRPGDLVVDPFLGSGTTLIAAEQLGRRCYGTELDPAYCDVIVERWQNLTGGKATRETHA